MENVQIEKGGRVILLLASKTGSPGLVPILKIHAIPKFIIIFPIKNFILMLSYGWGSAARLFSTLPIDFLLDFYTVCGKFCLLFATSSANFWQHTSLLFCYPKC